MCISRIGADGGGGNEKAGDGLKTEGGGLVKREDERCDDGENANTEERGSEEED